MTTLRPLQHALRQAANELERELPPPEVLAGVHAAFERLHPAPRRDWTWRLAGAAACVVLLFGSVLLLLRPDGTAEDSLRAGGFLLVAPADRWSDAAAGGPAWLVSGELSAERLAELGLPYDPSRAGEPVHAELLVHPAGDVLAVRLMR